MCRSFLETKQKHELEGFATDERTGLFSKLLREGGFVINPTTAAESSWSEAEEIDHTALGVQAMPRRGRGAGGGSVGGAAGA